MDHLDDMEQLKQGIDLMAYGQRDPAVEYKIQGFEMFNDMIEGIKVETVKTLYHIQVEQKVDGLSQYLSGQVNKEKILYSTNYSNVDFIFAGPYAPNPSELLEQELFSKLIEETRKGYDYVLIDTPPMLSMSDASIVAKQCDGAILVIQNEAVSRKDALRAKDQLKKSGCKLLGAVLNKVDMKKEKYYNRYNSYYYYGSKE